MISSPKEAQQKNELLKIPCLGRVPCFEWIRSTLVEPPLFAREVEDSVCRNQSRPF